MLCSFAAMLHSFLITVLSFLRVCPVNMLPETFDNTFWWWTTTHAWPSL
jgi:hypothetical protein